MKKIVGEKKYTKEGKKINFEATIFYFLFCPPPQRTMELVFAFCKSRSIRLKKGYTDLMKKRGSQVQSSGHDIRMKTNSGHFFDRRFFSYPRFRNK